MMRRQWRRLNARPWVLCPHCGFWTPEVRNAIGEMECPACRHTSGFEPEERTEPMDGHGREITEEALQKRVTMPDFMRRFARMMALRMNQKEPLVKDGAPGWLHWRHMSLEDLFTRLRQHVEEFQVLVQSLSAGGLALEELPKVALRMLWQAADIANFAMFIALRVAAGARLPYDKEARAARSLAAGPAAESEPGPSEE